MEHASANQSQNYGLDAGLPDMNNDRTFTEDAVKPRIVRNHNTHLLDYSQAANQRGERGLTQCDAVS